MPRGGARPGAGRPKNTERGVVMKLRPRDAMMASVLARALGHGSRMDIDGVVALLIEQAYTQLREMGGVGAEE